MHYQARQCLTLFKRFLHYGPNATYTAHLWSLSLNLTWLCLLLNALWTQSPIHQAKWGSNSERWSLSNVNTSFIFNLLIQCSGPSHYNSHHPEGVNSCMTSKCCPTSPASSLCAPAISSLSHILPVFLFFKDWVSLWVPLKGCEEKEAFFLRVALWKMTRGNVFILKTLLPR